MEIPKIAVVRRHLVCGTGHLQLAQLTCQRPDGRTHVWGAVERPRNVKDVVAAFAVAPERTVVLIEQFRPPVETRVLELPAGLCDQPGEAFEDAVCRELKEETGCSGVATYSTPPSAESSGTIVSRLHLFLVRVDERGAPERDAAEEFMAPIVVELPLDDLPAALLRYAAEHPDHLIDPKILTGHEWWQYCNGGAP